MYSLYAMLSFHCKADVLYYIYVAYLYLSPRIKGKINCLRPIDDPSKAARSLGHMQHIVSIVSRG